VYAGAVGYFGYGSLDSEGNEVEGEMDTCIALRTMVVKDGVAYLQAGTYYNLLFHLKTCVFRILH
jgi:anthranilate synthase component 1